MIKKRYFFESLVFAGVVFLIGFSWSVVQGYILTQYYVPDFVNSYAVVDELEPKVAFGAAYRYDGIQLVFGFLVLCGLYYGARIFITRLMKRERK